MSKCNVLSQFSAAFGKPNSKLKVSYYKHIICKIFQLFCFRNKCNINLSIFLKLNVFTLVSVYCLWMCRIHLRWSMIKMVKFKQMESCSTNYLTDQRFQLDQSKSWESTAESFQLVWYSNQIIFQTVRKIIFFLPPGDGPVRHWSFPTHLDSYFYIYMQISSRYDYLLPVLYNLYYFIWQLIWTIYS